MKRFLSIILALAMIVGMIPAVFAETTEGESVVYSPSYVFNTSVVGVSGSSITVKNYTDYSQIDRTKSSGAWKFVSALGRLYSTMNLMGSYLQYSSNSVDPVLPNALIFMIQVDKSGAYSTDAVLTPDVICGLFDAYMIHKDDAANYDLTTMNGITAMLASASNDADAIVKHVYSEDTNTNSNTTPVVKEYAKTVNLKNGEYYLIFQIGNGGALSNHGSSRTFAQVKSFTLTCEGTITASADKTELGAGETATVSAVVTDGEGTAIDSAVSYSSSDANVATVDATTGVVTPVGGGTAVITASATVDGYTVKDSVEIEVSIVKDPVFSFTTGAFNDLADIKDGNGNPRVLNATDYNYINKDVSSGRWAYVTSFNLANNLVGTSNSLFCAKEANFDYSALVLKTEFEMPGIYKPTLSFDVKYPYSGKLNMWVIPASEAGEISSYSDVYVLMDKAQYIGSVDQYSASSVSDNFSLEGNDVYLPAGDNYIIMTVTKGSGDTSRTDGVYYAYFSSLAFEHKAGVVAVSDKNAIEVGDTATISTVTADINGNLLDATVTYESLTPTVATVAQNGTVTGVSNGTARVKVTAETSEETYTDTIDIEVSVVWDPNYIFNYKAIVNYSERLEGSGSSLNIPIAKITSADMIDERVSTGIWNHYASINFTNAALYSGVTQMRANTNGENSNNAIVLNAKIDSTGSYKATIPYSKSSANGITNVYIVPKNYAASNEWNMATIDGVNAAKADSANANSEVAYVASIDMNDTATTENPYTSSTFSISEKEFYIVINVEHGNSTQKDNDAFTMIGALNLKKEVSLDATSDATSLEIGENANLSAKALDNRDNAVSADVTYESLTPTIATVSGSTVTAVAEGDAVIRATATIDGVTVTDTVTIKVSPKKVSVATQIGDNYSVKQWTMGADVKVTAPEISGKVFRHWVLGTEENGIPVSESASYTFKAVTNTYLTAVYSDEAPENAKVVEFYLENGGYVGSAVADGGKVELPDVPSITGYVFSAWKTDAKTEFTENTIVEDLLTKVVATFTAAKINDTEYSYGDKIVNTSETAKVWKRNNKIVAYGTEYTYYMWAKSEIEAVDGEKPTEPIIVLDAVSKDGARMIEYDAAGFEIIEAGILFGNGTEMTVDSCMYKAKSNRNLSHGQFTAKPAEEGYTTAKGYIIYEDGGEYKVVYSE